MNEKSLAIKTIFYYLLIMIVVMMCANLVFVYMNISFGKEIGLVITQFLSTGYVLLVINKNYEWEEIGFGKINKKYLLWFIPYMFIIISMLISFVLGVYENKDVINTSIICNLILILIGTCVAGFSEEVLFRGMLLNSFKSSKNLLGAMIISSIGFSITHITTVFVGNSLGEAIFTVFNSSLLGFSFVALTILINNIWPMIIFHSLWNFILMSSQILDINLSKFTFLCNPFNIVIGIILWCFLIKEHRKYKKYIFVKDYLY